MGTIGRRVRAALLVTAVAATAAVGAGGGTAPASAQAEPGYAVTVTPSAGVSDGSQVEVTTTGLSGSYIFGVLQCDASALDNLPSGFSGPCMILSIRFGEGTEDTVTVDLAGAFTASNGDLVRCGVEPEDCAIVSWSPNGWQAGTAIDMNPSPAVPARRSQEAGASIDVILTAPPATTGAQLAQCALPVGDDLASSSCSPTQPVTLDAEGHATVPFTLVSEVGSPAQPCGDRNCGMALFDGAGLSLGAGGPVIVTPDDGPPQLFSYSLVDVVDGTFVTVDLYGILNEAVHLAECDASVLATHDVLGGPCAAAQSLPANPDSGWTTLYVRLERSFTGSDGSAVTCADADDCVVALASDDGDFTSLPIHWNEPDVLAIAPADLLLDGQEITATGSGLRPDGGYRLLRCSPEALTPGQPLNQEACKEGFEDVPALTASADGSLTATVAAVQRFTTLDGRDVYCRDDCLVVLIPDYNPHGVTAAPYAMSPGQLGAAPSSGLQDGQPVDVSWSGTQPSYDGPLWWILQTGSWALGQCGAGILDDPSVANVFRQCTVPPGGGAVTITEPDGGTAIEVQATIQPPIGDPIDCTTGPEACVAVLVRVEQDASVTLLSSPLSFA